MRINRFAAQPDSVQTRRMTRVTLTFDNGPTPGITDKVLGILARANILSTFFVIGEKLDDPDAAALMRDTHAAGHWIGNHTLTHATPFGEKPDAAFAAREIGETERRIGALAHPDKLFRPYGREGRIGPHVFSRAAVDYLVAHRYTAVLWNSLPGDWRDPDGWVDACVADVARRDWSCVVLHDIPNACLKRLPDLIARLTDKGVRFAQQMPESVVLTRGGQVVNLPAELVVD
jgi:peptidoglycan-N-acetylglucosamine deacetylase